MRIIAGRFKGRRLAEPGRAPLRPTSDSLRETMFNVIGPIDPDARVLDGFAGTGALGLEALSRGAANVTFVEADRRSLEILRKNIALCGAAEQCHVVVDDFFRAAGRLGLQCSLVLLDPPYDEKDLARVVEAGGGLLAPGGRLVLEHSRRREPPDTAGALARARLILAGDSALSFYRHS